MGKRVFAPPAPASSKRGRTVPRELLARASEEPDRGPSGVPWLSSVDVRPAGPCAAIASGRAGERIWQICLNVSSVRNITSLMWAWVGIVGDLKRV